MKHAECVVAVNCTIIQSTFHLSCVAVTQIERRHEVGVVFLHARWSLRQLGGLREAQYFTLIMFSRPLFKGLGFVSDSDAFSTCAHLASNWTESVFFIDTQNIKSWSGLDPNVL